MTSVHSTTLSHIAIVGLLLTAIVPITGCGGTDFETVAVSGRVTLDGEGLADARVSFDPEAIGSELNAGPGSFAVTDGSGRFTLKTLDGQPGAVVGRHRIFISTFQGEVDLSAPNELREIKPERVPEKYSGGNLTFDVPPEGTDKANFELESDT